jgi:hypothetical protein
MNAHVVENTSALEDDGERAYAEVLKEVSGWGKASYLALLDAVAEQVVEEIKTDVCAQVHRKVKTTPWLEYQDGLPLHFTINGRTKASAMKCDHCESKLASNKYAAHLEKCMQKKGRRGSSSSTANGGQAASSAYVSKMQVYSYPNRIVYKEGRVGNTTNAFAANVGGSGGVDGASPGSVNSLTRKRSLNNGEGLFYVEPLPVPLPTHSTHGAYPYIYSTHEMNTMPGAQQATVPSQEAVNEMLGRICGVLISDSTHKMCVYKMSCKHHDAHGQAAIRSRLAAGNSHVRFRRVRGGGGGAKKRKTDE